MARDDDDDNGTEHGPAESPLGTILIHVGETRKGMKRLEGDVKEIKETLKSVVTTGECGRRMDAVAGNITAMMTDVREIRATRKPTGVAYPSLNPPNSMTGPMPQMSTTPTAAPTEVVVENYIEERRERARRSATFWITTVCALAGLLGGSAFGLIKLGRYVDRIEATTEESTRRDRDEISKMMREVRKELAGARTLKTLPVDAGRPPSPPKGATKRRVGGR